MLKIECMVEPIIKVSNVEKTFQVGEQQVQVLRGVSLEVEMGDFLVIIGPSGCGKSTLLNVILGLEEPNQGSVIFLGENIYANTDEDYRSSFRKKHIGMIYQQPNWIKSMRVVENVAFPLMLLGMEKQLAIEKALQLLVSIKMDKWAYYIPTELSGGQQQRISLARALANNPEIIIADEPTGNLDYQTGQEVMQMLASLNRDQGKTLVMVTHDLEYLNYAHAAVRMLDGNVIDTYRGNDVKNFFKDVSFKRGVSPTSPNTPAAPSATATPTTQPAIPVKAVKSPELEPKIAQKKQVKRSRKSPNRIVITTESLDDPEPDSKNKPNADT